MPLRPISGTSLRQMRRVVADSSLIALLAIAAKPAPTQSAAIPKERYLSPIEMASLSPMASCSMWFARAATKLRVVDLQIRQSRAVAFAVGRMPRGIAISPDGQSSVRHERLVRHRLGDRHETLKVVQTLPTGSNHSGVVIDNQKATLYVANRLSGDISVIDLKSGQETKRLLAGRGASYLALVARRQMDLLHAHLSQSRRLPEPAKFRNHGHRYRAANGCRAHAAAQCRRSLSCSAVVPMASSASRRNSGPRI